MPRNVTLTCLPTVDSSNLLSNHVLRRFSSGSVVYKRVLKGLAVTLMALILSACTTTAPQPEPVVVQPPEPPQNLEMLKALSDLNDLKEELKQLRNLVEKMQFESDNGSRRQQDLFSDLDRRLLDLERSQQNQQSQTVLNSNGTPSTSGDNALNTNGQTVLGGQSTAVDSVVVESGSAGTGNAVSINEQEQYEQAFELLKQSRYEDAINGFQILVDQWPDSELADDGFYWMSEARYVNREFESALNGFRTVVTRYPDSQRVPEAMLKVGYIQYDIGAYEDAAETFRDILARFPGHQVTVSAQTRLRRIEQTIQ